MTILKNKLNTYLTVGLHLISTTSLVVIALGATQSLKQLAKNQEHSTRALLMHLHKGHGHDHQNSIFKH